MLWAYIEVIYMNSLLLRLSVPIFMSTLLLCTTAAHAQYDTLFLDLAQGDEMTQLRLGLGETPPGSEGEKVTSMFYLSYFNSENTIVAANTNQDEQSVEILAIGAGGFGYLKDPNLNGGAEFDFELSQTRIDSLDNYKRTGIGFRTQLFIPLVAGLQSNIGFNIRPFFLSSDWDDQAQLEYEYQLGVEYAFSWDVALYAHYRYVSVINKNDDDIKLAEGTMLGLRARF
jgi:opacity protein-like surface antigen